MMPGTQEHVLQHCSRVENWTTNREYQEIFKDYSSLLKEIATEISKIEEMIKNPVFQVRYNKKNLANLHNYNYYS